MPDNDRLSRIEKILEEIIEERKKEAEERRKEAEERRRQLAEEEKRRKEIDRQLKNLSKEIGDLTRAWGEFSEDMVATSVRGQFRKILKNAKVLGPRINVSKDDRNYEVDFLVTGELNGINVVIVVSVKTKPRMDDFEQMEDSIRDLPHFLEEFKDRKRIGCFAFIRYNDQIEREAWRRGYYTLILSEDTAIISNPEDFVPRMI